MADSPFLQIVLTPQNIDKYRVSWRVDPAFVAPTPWTVKVEWSRGDDVWTVAASAVDPPDYIDFDLSMDESHGRGLFLNKKMRISLTDAASASYVAEIPFSPIEHRDFGILLDVVRREKQLLRYSGTKGWLLRRLYRGTRCSCYSDKYGGRVSTSCTTCYGTGFEGGYHSPIEWDLVIMSKQRHQVQTADPARGAAEVVVYAGRGLFEVPVYYGDVWVSGDGRRFFINSVETAAEFRSWPVALNVELRLIPPQDVIYTYQVP